jgi:serine/threonine protein kinase
MGYHASLDMLLNESHDALLARLVFKMCQKEPSDRITLSQVMEDDFWKKTHEIRSDFWTMVTRQTETIRLRQISDGLQKLSPTDLDTVYTLIEEHTSLVLKPIRVFEQCFDAWPLQEQVDSILRDWSSKLYWNEETLDMALQLSHRVQSSEVPDLIVISLIAMVFCTGTRCQMMTF